MKVFDSLRRIFGAKDTAAPRELRNKPNCMAWVKLGADRWNAQQLDGRAVKCVSVDPQGYWLVEPPQEMCVGSFAMAAASWSGLAKSRPSPTSTTSTSSRGKTSAATRATKRCGARPGPRSSHCPFGR